ncbi:unnamed protein product, partial [Symbiodinium sp. CCMP2456]
IRKSQARKSRRPSTPRVERSSCWHFFCPQESVRRPFDDPHSSMPIRASFGSRSRRRRRCL